MLLRAVSSHADINMWNPFYAIALLVLLTVSIPLTVLAVITTSIAISLMSLRALAVYCQLAFAVMSTWISPPRPQRISKSYRSSLLDSSQRQSPSLQRSRGCSNGGSTSSRDAGTPTARSGRLHQTSDSLTALLGKSELTRDFEGVGGWRVSGDDNEEALWRTFNSRLELPADVPTRRHKRSLTGGASPNQRWSFSREALRMSPVHSRSRTPVRFAIDNESGYFPLLSHTAKRRTSNSSISFEQRSRKSSRESSTSSSGSTGITMAIKEVGD